MPSTIKTAGIRPWRQFSLRTLLLLMLALSIGLALFAYRRQQARRQAAAVATIRKVGGDVVYDYQNVAIDPKLASPKSAVPSWLLKLLGEDFFHDVVSVSLITPSPKSQVETEACWKAVAQLAKLQTVQAHGKWVDGRTTTEALRHHALLRHLSLRDSDLQSADLAPLQALASLEMLELSGNPIDDDIAEVLSNFPKLTNLGLSKTQIGDDTISKLAKNSKLSVLSLNLTRVSDASVEELAELPAIELLMLKKGTKMTAEGINRLQEARPELSVQ